LMRHNLKRNFRYFIVFPRSFVYVLRGVAGIEPAPTVASCPVGEPSQRLLGWKGLEPKTSFS
jgi:hypothetical protein